ncbi:hypothetical protein KY285_023749 [Solanum tuberosum]|nr:hypothetical protein KY289_024081 [Solanum tuberosum]KAH0675948.1 hypothetical protein KY285_023749 [Solanum tuberosum]
MTSLLNQENNHDKEHTPNQRMEPLQHDQENLITMETTYGNVQGKMQGNQDATTKRTQAARHANAKVHIRTSNNKQHGKGEKANWKVKDKVNTNGKTMQQSKENGEKQPNNTNKEKTGKFVNFAPNEADYNNSPSNNFLSSQNEHEKGQVVVQGAGNEVNGQTEKITHKGHEMDPKIPPLIKVSSNFNIYRPRQQRTNQNSPKNNQNKPSFNISFTKNTNNQIPDPPPHCVPIFSY